MSDGTPLRAKRTVPRGTCGVCRASVAIRKDGTIRDHQNRTARPSVISGARVYPWCRGSAQPPEGHSHDDG